MPWYKRVVPSIFFGGMPYHRLSELSENTRGVLMAMMGTQLDYSNHIVGTELGEIWKRFIMQDLQGQFIHGCDNLDLNSLFASALARANTTSIIGDNISPREELISQTLDDVFAQADRELSRRRGLKGGLQNLSRRLMF